MPAEYERRQGTSASHLIVLGCDVWQRFSTSILFHGSLARSLLTDGASLCLFGLRGAKIGSLGLA